MKQFNLIALGVALFFLFSSSENVSAFSSNNADGVYKVKRGERPPIDLKKVPNDSYEKGKIQLKLKPYMEESIKDELIVAGKGSFVKTQNLAIDKLNSDFNVTQYKPLLHGLYERSSKSIQYRERHKAWGFHLWFELTLDPNVDIKEAVEKYAALDEVETAEPVYKKRLIGNVGFEDNESKAGHSDIKEERWTPNDTRYNEQWHYHNTGQEDGTTDKDIDLPEAWEIEKGNTDVIVAVIDEGVQYNHPDIAGNMWEDIGPEGTSTTPGDHGTHVAGTKLPLLIIQLVLPVLLEAQGLVMVFEL